MCNITINEFIIIIFKLKSFLDGGETSSQACDKVDLILEVKVYSFANYNPALYTTWVIVKQNKFKPYHEKESIVYVDGVGVGFRGLR